MGVFQCSNEEIYLEKLVFIARDFLTIIEICEEGHRTFMNACKILLLRVRRESSYIHQAYIKKSDFDYCGRWVATKLKSHKI